MKISAKSRYALHLMLALAMQGQGVNLSVKSVAESQGISEKYLEQIIPVLVRDGYVRSVRGARGGYHLVKDPEEYTVGMILRTVEGSIAPVSCLDDEVNQCARCKECVTLDLWEQVGPGHQQCGGPCDAGGPGGQAAADRRQMLHPAEGKLLKHALTFPIIRSIVFVNPRRM